MAQAVTPIRPTETLQSRETAGDRVRRLEAEATAAAREESASLKADLGDIAGRCLEVSKMKSISDGERDAMRRLSEEIETVLTRVQAIGARVS
ncbi:hypothetical protein [Phenylobacterium sp.]|uniref:hypothetical protein n=1 Tax=Phenylobacterium sp. TaxID=1871053 RepID=UPI002737F4DD|nr:hypothetical protein [Phenylobacterium sp.]MDP3869139.1 hypothetical protein [Phenylobacterium sp.]